MLEEFSPQSVSLAQVMKSCSSHALGAAQLTEISMSNSVSAQKDVSEFLKCFKDQ